jgi:hypothetical protein
VWVSWKHSYTFRKTCDLKSLQSLQAILYVRDRGIAETWTTGPPRASSRIDSSETKLWQLLTTVNPQGTVMKLGVEKEREPSRQCPPHVVSGVENDLEFIQMLDMNFDYYLVPSCII